MDDMNWLITMLRSDNPEVRNDGLMANFRIGEGSIYALAACLSDVDSELAALARQRLKELYALIDEKLREGEGSA